MAFDKPRNGDEVVQIDGFSVVVDSMTAEQIDGAKIDFVQGLDASGFKIVTPDRPGIGGTDRRRLNQLADWADDAADLLDTLQIESAAFLGVSGGGPFAAACAARMPGRVRTLMLVAPLGSPEHRAATGSVRSP